MSLMSLKNSVEKLVFVCSRTEQKMMPSFVNPNALSFAHFEQNHQY